MVSSSSRLEMLKVSRANARVLLDRIGVVTGMIGTLTSDESTGGAGFSYGCYLNLNLSLQRIVCRSDTTDPCLLRN